uniref:C-type lectin domain-containing protein n=1 Tax=Parascaris univalens TaxID=6257 RepID=A0A915AK13_PARUN
MLWFRIATLLAAFCWQHSQADSCDRMQVLGDKLTKLFTRMGPPLLKLAQQLSTVEELLESKCNKALDDYRTCNKFLEEAKSLESSLEGKCSKLRGLGGSGSQGDYGSGYGDGSGRGNGGSGGNGNEYGNGHGDGGGNGNGGMEGAGGNGYNGDGRWNKGNGGGAGNNGNGAGSWKRWRGAGGNNIQVISAAQLNSISQKTAVETQNIEASETVQQSPCPSEWKKNGSYCYRFMTASHTWQDAESVCVGMGGHLASIHSGAENAFIIGLSGIGSFYGAPANTLLANAWIGLKGYGSSAWHWVDGTVFDYQYWGPMYPSWHFEQCGQLIYRSLNNGRFSSSILSTWNNFECSMAVENFVCKKKAT